jgi:substrate-binding family protein
MLCGSEELALAAREALRQHGRDVPRDVSLIGFEHKLTHSRSSNVTSVSIDTLALGRELARMATALNESFGEGSARSYSSGDAAEAKYMPPFPAGRRYGPKGNQSSSNSSTSGTLTNDAPASALAGYDVQAAYERIKEKQYAHGAAD